VDEVAGGGGEGVVAVEAAQMLGPRPAGTQSAPRVV
jgi:hypothetical protein